MVKIYVIKNKNEVKFIRRSKKGNFVICNNIGNATKYKEYFVANNVLLNCLPLDYRRLWYVEDVDEIISNNSQMDFEELLNSAGKISKQRQDLLSKLSNSDMEIQDILHYIRDEPINVIKWVKIFKILREIVIFRAKVKEEMRQLEVIVSTITNNLSKEQLQVKLYDSGIKKYVPRTNLYEKLKNL